MTTPGQAVQKKGPSHRLGVDVRWFNRDGPQIQGLPKRTLEPPSDPALPLTAIDPDKGALRSAAKRPTRFRQPSSQEQHMERHSMSTDRCLA